SVTVLKPVVTASRNSASLIAGTCVKSPVGFSTCNGITSSSAPAVRASWLMAAPPAAKLATICAVTSAGKAETPRAVMPCEPAKTRTETGSRTGTACPRQRAMKIASSSSRPRLPGGLVSTPCLSAAACAAASSPPGRAAARERMASMVSGKSVIWSPSDKHGCRGGQHRDLASLLKRAEHVACLAADLLSGQPRQPKRKANHKQGGDEREREAGRQQQQETDRGGIHGGFVADPADAG